MRIVNMNECAMELYIYKWFKLLTLGLVVKKRQKGGPWRQQSASWKSDPRDMQGVESYHLGRKGETPSEVGVEAPSEQSRCHPTLTSSL